jgi:hypothetical protein
MQYKRYGMVLPQLVRANIYSVQNSYLFKDLDVCECSPIV